MNKKTIIPAFGTIIILSSLLLYFIGSAIGLFTNPFFEQNIADTNHEIVKTLENINKNAPKNTWNSNSLEIPSEQITKIINENIQSLESISPFISITIKDALTNKTLYSLNENEAMPAASSIKILSMIASIETLGQNYQFTTKTTLGKNNNIYLQSNGDILLNTEENNPQSTIGYAGLKTLAEKTAQKLQKQKIEKVILNLDDTYFGNEKTLSSWEKQKVSNSIGQIIPIAINRGLTPDESTFIQNPSQQVAEIFANHLNQLGIKVETINFEQKTPKKTKQIAEIKSDKLSNIIKFALKKSDNTLTETITRAAAINSKYKPTFKDTTRFVKNTIKLLEINTKNLEMEDTSGLSNNNKVTTTTLTSALEKTFIDNPNLFTIYESLPISGIDGTLEKRFLDIPGKVIAKTGTLPQTSSLTGIIITNSTRVLSFSINTTGFTEENLWNIRVNTDKLIQELQKL